MMTGILCIFERACYRFEGLQNNEVGAHARTTRFLRALVYSAPSPHVIALPLTATWFRSRWWEDLGATHTVGAFDPRQWQLFLPAELRAILLSKMAAGVHRITEYTHSRFAWWWLGEICETFHRRMVDSALSVGMPDLPNHKCQHRKRSKPW